MRMRGMLSRVRNTRITVVFLALLLSFGLISHSPRADGDLKAFSIELGGLTGGANNMVLVFGRYVLVAPFAPSTGVLENGDLDLEQLDNDLVYLIDTKKPNSAAISKELKVWDSKSGTFKKVFYPSRVVFDSSSSIVYVRGTKFEDVDGQITPIDVIAYVKLSEDAGGKPVFDNNVVIEIPGVSDKRTSDAPLDLAFSGAGDVLVFTNGASVFSFNVVEGFLQEVKVIAPEAYSADNAITFLDVDQATNIVSICVNRQTELGGEVLTRSSELSFYRLNQFGSFQPLAHLAEDSFAEGEALASGSNVTIMSDSGKEGSATALFITNTGSLCALDLGGDASASVRRLYTYRELADLGGANSSPITIKYDSSQRLIGIVRSGFTIQISRPTNGKHGRISRPTNIHIASGTPVLALAKLNKKNKLSSVNSFSADFVEEGGLSNFVAGQDAQWLISTYSGKLYSVNLTDDAKDTSLELVGSIGSNVDRIDYYSDRSSIVAMNSFTPDQEGIQMASRGSLVVVRLVPSTASIAQALVPSIAALVKPATGIRRPCNIRR